MYSYLPIGIFFYFKCLDLDYILNEMIKILNSLI